MSEKEQHIQKEPEHKWRTRDGSIPSYRAFHEVYITKDLGPERNADLISFIDKHITEFKGKTEDKHGIPLMLFEREQDAQKFANELRRDSMFKKNTSQLRRGNIRANIFRLKARTEVHNVTY